MLVALQGFSLIVAGIVAVILRRPIARVIATGIRAVFGRAVSEFVAGGDNSIVVAVLGVFAIFLGAFAAFAGLVLVDS